MKAASLVCMCSWSTISLPVLPCRGAEAQLFPIQAVALSARRGKSAIAAGADCADKAQPGDPGVCMLFARRFPMRTSEAVLRMLHDRSTSLGIIEKPDLWTAGVRVKSCAEPLLKGL